MRLLSVSALVVLGLALPATATATDPLVSGYAGPGGGDQALLGAELLPGPAGGGESSAAEERPLGREAVATAPAGAIDDAAASQPSVPSQAQTARGGAGDASSAGDPGAGAGEEAGAGASEGTSAATQATVRYPVSEGASSWVSGGLVLQLLLAALALGAVAAVTVRLGGGRSAPA